MLLLTESSYSSFLMTVPAIQKNTIIKLSSSNHELMKDARLVKNLRATRLAGAIQSSFH